MEFFEVAHHSFLFLHTLYLGSGEFDEIHGGLEHFLRLLLLLDVMSEVRVPLVLGQARVHLLQPRVQ